jgi:hypothetical protein
VLWRHKNTPRWQEAQIDLRCEDDARGVGAYALKRFDEDEVLGENQGKWTPASDELDSRYMFRIDNYLKTTLLNIDSMRLGNWTRFVNHSCVPNAKFQVVTAGFEVAVIVRTKEPIDKEHKITVDYCEKYREMMNANGVWCQCGESYKYYKGNNYRFSKDTGTAKGGKTTGKRTNRLMKLLVCVGSSSLALMIAMLSDFLDANIFYAQQATVHSSGCPCTELQVRVPRQCAD